MMAEDKHVATARRLEEPPLCEYGDRAVSEPYEPLELKKGSSNVLQTKITVAQCNERTLLG